MSKRELIEELTRQGIQASTISFYCTKDHEECEASFGTCDLSGVKGDVVPCIALDDTGAVIEFEAGTWLVHGHLGRLAGAF